MAIFGAVGQMFANVERSKNMNSANFNTAIPQTENLLIIHHLSNYLTGGLGIYYIGNGFVKYNFKIGYSLNKNILGKYLLLGKVSHLLQLII